MFLEGLLKENTCEGDEMTLNCPKGQVIAVRDALYGRTDPDICSDIGPIKSTMCSASNALTKVKQL
jgi:hypothetical protein